MGWNRIGNLRGPDGNPGPVNQLTIGTVSSGTQADATITGDAPDQTLNLVLPKGDIGPAWAPPFVSLLPTGTTSFGNGLDGRTPAVNCNAGALGGAYCGGTWSGPWSTVDVYVAWLQNGANNTGQQVVFTTYLKALTDGVSAGGKPIVSNQQVVPVSNVQFGYHETLVASGVAFTPNVIATSTVARYGQLATDTYTQAIGIVAVVLRPHDA